MRRFRALELVSTRFLGLTVLVTIALTCGGYGAVVYLGLATADALATFTDAVFKTVALLVGSLWALNRYFVERTDEPQFRVDADVSLVRGDSWNELGLLIFRLDLVNTSKAQIGRFGHFVEIDAAIPRRDGVELEPLYRWPSDGLHPGGPIEPGSWAAINDEVSCPCSVKAVRIFVGVRLAADAEWTWHKTFDVSRSLQ